MVERFRGGYAGVMSDSDHPPASDRRRSYRHPIELKVEYKRLNTFFADYTKNISRGGTFIGTVKPLPIGTEFVFALEVPMMSEPLKLRGRVIWTTSTDWNNPDKVFQVDLPAYGTKDLGAVVVQP